MNHPGNPGGRASAADYIMRLIPVSSATLSLPASHLRSRYTPVASPLHPIADLTPSALPPRPQGAYLMPLLPPLQPMDATREVQEIYEDFRRRMSFPAPPNFILTQGHSSAVARGTWDLVRNVLVGGRLPRWMKELMFVAISIDRECQYCTAAHVACCRMLGVDPGVLAGVVRDVEAVSDLKLRAVLRFAVKCARQPRDLTEADYDSLREHGLHNADIAEVIGMSGLAVYANILADATGMEEDSMFAAVAGQPASAPFAT